MKRIKKLKVFDEHVEENHAITVLTDAEGVLMKRISKMREGKPRTTAQGKLKQLQSAIGLLKRK